MSEEVQTTVAEEQQTPTQSATTTEAPARFIDSLAEDVRNEPSLQNIQDVDQLAKGYVHAQRKVGADKIPLPNKHATDDDWNQFYSRLGRPDTPEGYEVQYTPPAEGYEPTNLPGFQVDVINPRPYNIIFSSTQLRLMEMCKFSKITWRWDIKVRR